MEKLKKTAVKKETEKKEVKEEITNEKIETVEVKKTKRQIISELNKARKDIDVEIMNVSSGSVSFFNKLGYAIFDLQPSETAIVSLEDMMEVCKCKSYFRQNLIIITDVYADDYSLDDIFMFLKLDQINANINYDLIGEILEYDDDEFERVVNKKSKDFVKNIACRAIYSNNQEDDDYELSRRKENILCERLNLDRLIY